MLRNCIPYCRSSVLLICAFLLVTCQSHSPVAPFSVSPSAVKYGQSTEVVIKGVTSSDRISLSPGGPERVLLFPTSDKLLAMGGFEQMLLVAFDNAELHLYELISATHKNGTPGPRLELIRLWKVKSNIRKIVTRGSDAVLLDSSKDLYHISFNGNKKIEPKMFASLKSDPMEVTSGLNYVNVLTAAGKLKRLQVSSAFDIVDQSEYDLPCKAKHHSVVGQRLFLACSTLGFVVLQFEAGKLIETHRFMTSGSVLDFTIHNDVAYIADGIQGLAILDVSSANSPQLLGSNNKLGFVSKIADFNEPLVVSNAQSQLIAVDLSQQNLPLVQNTVRFTEPVIAIHTMGHGLVVATKGKLEWVNLQAESSQTISSIGVNLGGSRRGFINNEILYVADWFSGLHMYDISTPRNISHLGNYHTPGSSKGVVVHNNYAFIGDDDHGLQIVDVSNPSVPVFVSKIATSGLAYTLKVMGNLVYLADHRGGFHIIDIANIKHPKIIGSVNTPGKAWAVDVSGEYAYVADDTTGLLVFDVSTPSAPKLVNQFNPNGYAEDVRIRGNIAYVAFFDKGLTLLDISNPRKLVELSSTPVPGNARGIELLDDNIVLVAAWEAGLQIFDISDVTKPLNIAYMDTDGSAWGVNVHNHTAYVLDWWGGVKVVDVRNPRKPKQMARYHAKDVITKFEIKGNYAYAISTVGGLHVFDIKNAMNPVWVTGLDFNANVLDIRIRGNTAYVATQNSIEIIDIQDPFYLHWLGVERVAQKIKNIFVNDNYLVTHNENKSLSVFSVEQPTGIEYLFNEKILVEELRLFGNQVLVLDSKHNLTRYEISSTQKLLLIENWQLDFNPKLVSFSKNKIAYYEPNRGLHVVHYNKKDSPRVFHQLNGNLSHLELLDDALLAVLDQSNLVIYSALKDQSYVFEALYPGVSRLGKFVKVANHVLFAGSRLLSSVELLPEYVVKSTGPGQKSVVVPKGFPVGKYHVMVTNSKNKTTTYFNSIDVVVAPGKKSTLTKEKFEELLKKHKSR